VSDGAPGALDHPCRNYKDTNHKPEMVLALTRFQAVAGFRAPRRAVEVLAGLDSPLARRMRRTLRLNPTRYGIRQVFSDVVSAATRPSPQEIDALVTEIAARFEAGTSPSLRVDSNVVKMADTFPGDPGIAAAPLPPPSPTASRWPSCPCALRPSPTPSGCSYRLTTDPARKVLP